MTKQEQIEQLAVDMYIAGRRRAWILDQITVAAPDPTLEGLENESTEELIDLQRKRIRLGSPV
jgi:hypothetical protein